MTTTGQHIDALAAFKFELRIDDLVVAWFTECSGVTLEREVIPHQEGGLNQFIHHLPGRVKRQNVTLKRGIAGEELWQWFQSGRTNGQVKRQHVSVILYRADRTIGKEWNMSNAYPTKWEANPLKSSGNQVAVASLELAQDSGGAGVGSTVSAAVQRQKTEQVDRQEQPVQPEIDLQVVAGRVYDLIKQDLRLERERAGKHWF